MKMSEVVGCAVMRSLFLGLAVLGESAFGAPADQIWFHADFDTTPVVDGEAFLDSLPEDEMVDGRFGRACAFRSRYWQISDPEQLKNFPREAGTLSCFFRSEESALTNRDMNVIGYCGFWTYNWGWGDGTFRTSGKVPGWVQFRYLKGGSPVKRKKEWQHFAATWNADLAVVYVNGEKVAQIKNPPIDDIRGKRGEKFEIGSFGDGRKAAKLVLDDVAVFRRVLDAAEIRSIAAGKSRPRLFAPELLTTPIRFKTFYRDDDNAALRCRLVAEKAETFKLKGEVGGRPVPEQEVCAEKGDVPLVVRFTPGAYRPGVYPYSFRLVDATGRVRLEKRGELVVKPQLNPNSFRFLCWGGYDSLTADFLNLAGFTSVNVGFSPSAIPAIRKYVDAGICPNIRYENWRRDKGATKDEAKLERVARKELSFLEGLFPWTTTLVNSEVYGGAPKDNGIKNPPAEINFKALGVPPPTGIITNVPPQYGMLQRYFKSEMSPYRYNAAAYRAIKSIAPDNVVWSEPMFRGASEGLDMMADWFYSYSAISVLAEMRARYAAHRPVGKPFMPTLAMVYWHPLSKEGRARKLAQTFDEVSIKTWIAAGAVRLDALSGYEADAWQRGLSPTNGLCETDAAARYGKFFRERFLPAAELLRGLEAERAKVAVLALPEIDWMAGFWWGRVHFRNAIYRGLARDGIPFDVLTGDEVTAERLKGYRFIVLPMGKMLLPEHHAALMAAAQAGVVVVQDKYGVFDFPGGTKVDALQYVPGLVQPRGGLAKMYAPLGSFMAPHRDALVAAQAAHSSCDVATNGFTFAKDAGGGVKHVVVVNNHRRAGGCPQTEVFTNAWYKPMGAPQRITTWFDVPPGGEVREFNPKPGSRRIVAKAPAGGGRVSITADYDGAEGRVFGIYPRPDSKLSMDVVGSPARGSRAMVRIRVRDSVGLVADRRVLRVVVTDPDGRRHDSSGLYVTKDGVAEVVLRFAADDSAGSLSRRWRLEAEELSSGATASTTWSFEGWRPDMDAILTVPHELDCLLKSGHIQGACCSEQGIYLSHALGIDKIGWDGKLLKHVEAPGHLGDSAYANGRVYGAFVIRDPKIRVNGKQGLVRVWDEDLNQVDEAWFDEALDGIAVLGDTIYVGVDKWGYKPHAMCCVKRLGLDLSDRGNVDIDLGYSIHYGVQTMATDGRSLFFGNYGARPDNPEKFNCTRLTPDLEVVESFRFSCSEGLGLVPRTISKRDTPVFFTVNAMGGNMQGWRSDPKNNPPRIRIEFFEWRDDWFKPLTPAARGGQFSVGAVNCGAFHYGVKGVTDGEYSAGWDELARDNAAATVFFYEDVGTNLFPKGSHGVAGLDIRAAIKDGKGEISVVKLPREIEVDGKMRRTPRYRALRVVRDLNGKKIAFYGLHLVAEGHIKAPKPPKGEMSFSQKLRREQFKALIADAKQFDYAVFAGDFNAQKPFEYDVFVEAGYRIANCSDEFGVHATLRNIPADNVVVSPGLAIAGFEVPKSYRLNTDHFPVVVRAFSTEM